jgi:predicted PolB exonuclease-like 3'-5' exonuclease
MSNNNQTIKEEAIELIEIFRLNVLDYEGSSINTHEAKQCVLVLANEIYKLNLKTGAYLDTDPDKKNYYSYWEELKQEIEIEENDSNIFTTTGTTHLCLGFEPAFQPSPKVASIQNVPCKKCGKYFHQHPIISNTKQ